MDVGHGEQVEKELDTFIERRSRKKASDDEHELWRESVEAYEEKRRQLARLEWHAFHRGQVDRHRRTLEELISYHETQAERYLPRGAA